MIFNLVLLFYRLSFPSLKLISRTTETHTYHLAFQHETYNNNVRRTKTRLGSTNPPSWLDNPGKQSGGGGHVLEVGKWGSTLILTDGAQTPGLSSRAPWHLGKRLRLRFAGKGTAQLSTYGFRNLLWGSVFIIEDLILLSNAQCYKLGFHLLH